MAKDDPKEVLEKARALVAQLGDMRPAEVDVRAVSKFVLPGSIEMHRTALLWRADELARSTLRAIDAKDAVTATLLTRSLMETSAALYHLHGMIQRGIKDGVTAQLIEAFSGFMTGSKMWEDIGGAINVLTMIGGVAKEVPGYVVWYNLLSEYAHPNHSGTLGAYGKIDPENFLVHYGNDKAQSIIDRIIPAFDGAVSFIVYFSPKVEKTLPDLEKATAAYWEKHHADEANKGAETAA